MHQPRDRLLYVVVLAVSASCAPKLLPAVHARVDATADVYHGVRVADPYQWLETDSKETRAYTKAQNARTRAALKAVPGRKAIRERIAALMKIGTLSTPAARKRKDGSLRYFYTRRRAGENHAILYVREGLRGADRVLLDPNKMSKDGTTALDWFHLSDDGALVAYGTSESGDEQSTLRVLDVDTGKHLKDVIPRARACSLAWLKDNSGFYYTRYPWKGEVPEAEAAYHRRVYFHALGSDPQKDPHVFGIGRDMKDWPSIDLSPDNRWLVATASHGYKKTEVYLKDRSKEGAPWVPLAEGIEALFHASAYDDRILVHTNHEAPRYRVYAVDPLDPTKKTTLIPESDDVLQGASLVGGALAATYLQSASTRLFLFDRDGKNRRELALPGIGTAWGFGGRHDGDEAFFGFTSFAVAPSIYRVDAKTALVGLWDRIDAPIAEGAFEVTQVRYPSKDRTQVSMFIIHKKGLAKDGTNPAYLSGYGGFNVSTTPSFLSAAYLFLEKGGVIAFPNLRGGGEYGESWHEAGMLAKKQNTFDDFIAAAEWLIANRYTNKERLAISGGSNGGLLVGAALVQRPDLFRAAVCMVPLLDMLRYHRFLIAKLWIPEYGSSDDKAQFEWLRAYSPYHHVKEGTRYPAVLFTAGESDSRVHPLHARKMAARVQAATASGPDRPVLLRIETKAGHGQGKPIAKVVDELTDRWSFVFWQLGMKM